MKTETSWSTSAPLLIGCFDAGLISKIITVILYSYFRHAISKVNRLVIKQIDNFPFVTNNPVIFFQVNVIGLFTFSMQKGAVSRPVFARVFGVCCFLREVLFYCFSPKRCAGNTLNFACLVICIRTIAREFFPQFAEMPDRPPPLFRHSGALAREARLRSTMGKKM